MEGTLIILNIWSGDHDEHFWKDPMKFDPNRFISPDGKLTNMEKVCTFGFGKKKMTSA